MLTWQINVLIITGKEVNGNGHIESFFFIKMVVQLKTNQQAILAGLSGAEPLSVHCREQEVVAAL